LGPFLERMIVALVAVEPHPEKGLAHVLRDLARLTQRPVIIHFRIPVGTALGEQHLANKLIVGLVPGDRPLNPVAKHPDALLSQMFAVALEEIRPFVGLIFVVISAGQQSIYQLLALLPALSGIG